MPGLQKIAPCNTAREAIEKNQKDVAQRNMAALSATIRKMSAIISGWAIPETVV
jgi:hypothetical protein